MWHNRKKAPWYRQAALLLTASLLLLSAGSGLAAQKSAPAATPPAPSGWGDDGIKEVGVEWINDFPGTKADRDHWDESCDGLYDWLVGVGWVGKFHYTDWSVWETDLKNESLGGAEDTYVDSADIAMVCTHGSAEWDSAWGAPIVLSSVLFGSEEADRHLVPGDAYHAFGDKDLEWLAFDSCSVLSDTSAAYWAASMNGLHLLLGFKNTMYVGEPGDGYYWGPLMTGWWQIPSTSVMQSWFLAVDLNQPNVTCARVIAETYNNFDDHLSGYGYVSPDPPINGISAFWDHCSTQGLFSTQIEQAEQILSVPVIQVVPRSVDTHYVWDYVAPAFEMTGTVRQNDGFFSLVDATSGQTRTLLVDQTTGGFIYNNPTELWVRPVTTPTLPSDYDAQMMLQVFFGMQGADLPGIQYRGPTPEVLTEQMVTVALPTPGSMSSEATVLAAMPTNLAVTYDRSLTVGAQTAAGLQQTVFPVVGPGARLKAYVGDGSEIVGMQGGTRDISVTSSMVDVVSSTEAWSAYLADPTISIPEVPWPTDQASATSAMLGYYEHQMGISQAELIPVWIFTADYYSGTILLAADVPVYVPASATYLPPQVQIDAPAAGATFRPGEVITFTGSVVQYGKPPFTYEWTASGDGVLGSGATIQAALGPVLKGNGLYSQTVSLQVTDANGQIGTATVPVLIQMAIYLPVTTK